HDFQQSKAQSFLRPSAREPRYTRPAPSPPRAASGSAGIATRRPPICSAAVTAPRPRLTISNDCAVKLLPPPEKFHGSDTKLVAFSGAGGPRPSKPTKGLQPDAAPQPPLQLVWQNRRPVWDQPVMAPQLIEVAVLPVPVWFGDTVIVFSAYN